MHNNRKRVNVAKSLSLCFSSSPTVFIIFIRNNVRDCRMFLNGFILLVCIVDISIYIYIINNDGKRRRDSTIDESVKKLIASPCILYIRAQRIVRTYARCDDIDVIIGIIRNNNRRANYRTTGRGGEGYVEGSVQQRKQMFFFSTSRCRYVAARNNT